MILERDGFKQIPGYPGYSVSPEGDVYSARMPQKKLHPRGKGVFALLNAQGVAVTVPASHAVALAFLPNPDGHRFVRFRDGNRENRRPENLEWYSKVFAPADRAEARRLYDLGTTQAEIARQFGCGQGAVSSLLRGMTHKGDRAPIRATPRTTDGQRQAINDLRRQGRNMRQIASEVGVSAPTVHYHVSGKAIRRSGP